MIIYNQSWLKNLVIKEQIHHELRSEDITTEELKNIETAYPIGFYSPNIFVRIGLFILTSVIFSFSSGLISLIFLGSQAGGQATWCLVMAIAGYVALEMIVRQNNHFNSGADDALMWICGGFTIAAFFFYTEKAFNQHNDTTQILFTSGFILLLALYFTLRFANPLMAVICFLALLIFLAVTWNHTGTFGTATLPFFVMILSGLSYFFSSQSMRSLKTIYYRNCLKWLQVAGLLIFYLAGNYYVVQQLGDILYGSGVAKTYHVPMPWLFWTWTVLMPFVYIGFGIKKKDVILLRTGSLLIAAAAFTFRNYYHVMPIEATLVLLGIIMLSIAYGLIRYLKTPKNGITYEDLDENSLSDNLKIESLVVSSIPTSTPGATADRFGGGSFGGGGSSGNF